MGYLVLEMIVFLIIAAAIGFAFGWSYRDITLKIASKSEQEPSQTVEVEAKKAHEHNSQEKVTEEKGLCDEDAPQLFTEKPETGQDKLSTIKGIGPVIEKQLNELGIYQFEQIASWTREQELWISSKIAFPKRVVREEWVKQAQELLKNKA